LPMMETISIRCNVCQSRASLRIHKTDTHIKLIKVCSEANCRAGDTTETFEKLVLEDTGDDRHVSRRY